MPTTIGASRRERAIRRRAPTHTTRRASGACATLSGWLGLTYFLTGHEPYAERTALLLRTWFFEPKTRMNPHLRYRQAIAGTTEGRSIGIIDTARVPELPDRVELLRGLVCME